MRLGYIKDENGNLVRQWVKEGEERNPEFLLHVGATFGDYIFVNEDHIEVAKAALLEHMIDAIRELAKNDKFWIVKSPDSWNAFSHPDNIIDPVPKAAKDGKTSVAWQINFPQMEGYYSFEDAQQLEKELNACFSTGNE